MYYQPYNNPIKQTPPKFTKKPTFQTTSFKPSLSDPNDPNPNHNPSNLTYNLVAKVHSLRVSCIVDLGTVHAGKLLCLG